MSTLYSIQGMHEINSQGTSYYKGRQWPGSAPTAVPRTANEKAFNIIFSVFIVFWMTFNLNTTALNVWTRDNTMREPNDLVRPLTVEADDSVTGVLDGGLLSTAA